MATKKDDAKIFQAEIIPVKFVEVPIRIVGDTPLIVHNWSEKAKRKMLEDQMQVTKKADKKAREPKDPFDDFIQSMYWLTEKPESTPEAFEEAVRNGAKWGFPVTAIKKAANTAAYENEWVLTRTGLKGTYFLKTEYKELAEIKGCVPTMREDPVNIGKGKSRTSDLRYRAEYKDWYMDLILSFNKYGKISFDQIMNCISAGGACYGIGEWRPQKDGINGMFHVEPIA